MGFLWTPTVSVPPPPMPLDGNPTAAEAAVALLCNPQLPFLFAPAIRSAAAGAAATKATAPSTASPPSSSSAAAAAAAAAHTVEGGRSRSRNLQGLGAALTLSGLDAPLVMGLAPGAALDARSTPGWVADLTTAMVARSIAAREQARNVASATTSTRNRAGGGGASAPTPLLYNNADLDSRTSEIIEEVAASRAQQQQQRLQQQLQLQLSLQRQQHTQQGLPLSRGAIPSSKRGGSLALTSMPPTSPSSADEISLSSAMAAAAAASQLLPPSTSFAEAVAALSKRSQRIVGGATLLQPHIWGVDPLWLGRLATATEGAAVGSVLPSQAVTVRGSASSPFSPSAVGGGASSAKRPVPTVEVAAAPPSPGPRPSLLITGLFTWVYDNFRGAQPSASLLSPSATTAAAPPTGVAPSFPFPVHVMVTELPDDRLGEPVQGGYTLCVGATAVDVNLFPPSIVSRVSLAIHDNTGQLTPTSSSSSPGSTAASIGGGAMAAASSLLPSSGGADGAAAGNGGGVPVPTLHSRLLLQAHQRSLRAFWAAALPGCVSAIAPETPGELHAALRRVNTAVAGEIILENSVLPVLSLPPLASEHTLWRLQTRGNAPSSTANTPPAATTFSPRGGGTAGGGAASTRVGSHGEAWERLPVSKLPPADTRAAEPLTRLADALAYGAAEPYRPPVGAVAREVLRQAAVVASAGRRQ